MKKAVYSILSVLFIASNVMAVESDFGSSSDECATGQEAAKTSDQKVAAKSEDKKVDAADQHEGLTK